MTVGVVYCELVIYDAQSLKEKRSVVKSITTRLKQRYNISVAEVNHQEVWQRSGLALASISNNRQQCEKELARALALIDVTDGAERTITDWEWL
ncbi:DUF503 domain-containing protein [Shouchella shacheensis]|uniref:DUF503 domain-containing protein n=1 Tax=Shouchella shacheensis TaxID=1649580 RepID=UPI0007400325|nr:DUF503 family protein [Shouchella shacheensis]